MAMRTKGGIIREISLKRMPSRMTLYADIISIIMWLDEILGWVGNKAKDILIRVSSGCWLSRISLQYKKTFSTLHGCTLCCCVCIAAIYQGSWGLALEQCILCLKLITPNVKTPWYVHIYDLLTLIRVRYIIIVCAFGLLYHSEKRAYTIRTISSLLSSWWEGNPVISKQWSSSHHSHCVFPHNCFFQSAIE